MIGLLGGRKFLAVLASIGCCVWRPDAAPSIAIIAAAFCGAHAAADWKNKPLAQGDV